MLLLHLNAPKKEATLAKGLHWVFDIAHQSGEPLFHSIISVPFCSGEYKVDGAGEWAEFFEEVQVQGLGCDVQPVVEGWLDRH